MKVAASNGGELIWRPVAHLPPELELACLDEEERTLATGDFCPLPKVGDLRDVFLGVTMGVGEMGGSLSALSFPLPLVLAGLPSSVTLRFFEGL